MDAKELRIGNWIYNNLIEEKELFQISKGYEIDSADDPIRNYQPIPLSPDILEKCGFVYDSKEKECWEYEGIKIWDGGDDNYYHINSETITYFEHLHKLQNFIYFVTGEEIEFKP